MSQIKIIAEIAQGFEGKIEQAKSFMKAAADAGADAVKYQLVYADELATPDYNYYDLFKKLEMSDSSWKNLADYSNELSIELQLDIFGVKSLSLAQEIGVKNIKLHGTDIANIDLLNRISESTINSVLLGAGGAHMSELETALKILKDKSVVVLLGFQGYPTPNETNQISRVKVLIDHFGARGQKIEIGFADHSDPESMLAFALPAMAIGAGARVIEKHLTFGKVMKLEDYESALNIDQFAEFTLTMKQCGEAYGKPDFSDDFNMSQAEAEYRKVIRRHVVTARDIVDNSSITPSDLTLKRTSAIDFITDLSLVYGKRSNRYLPINTPISNNDIQ